MRRISALCVVTCSLIPFVIVYVAHLLNPEGAATGFLFYDMPYYAANGREIFDRGTGWSYPNPYLSDSPPAIYFHWLILLIGSLTVLCGLDPGVVVCGTGLCAAFGTAWLTRSIVLLLLPEELRQRRVAELTFLLSMWGGGAFALAAFGLNLSQGLSPFHDLTRLDPFHGEWALTWGRNLLWPLEAVYHCLIAGMLLAALRSRPWIAVACAGLLAATHPWSGLQACFSLIAIFMLEQIWFRRKSEATPAGGRLVPLGTLAIILTSFLSYYFIFLNQYPAHRSLQDNWTLNWSVANGVAVLAWGPVMGLAVFTLFRQADWTRERVVLMAYAAVALGLALHDRIAQPTQPLHFTRGHVWFPLFLLSVPTIARFLCHARIVIVLGILCLSVLDNVAFVAQQTRTQLSDPESRFRVSDDARAMFGWLRENQATGVLMTEDADLNYLSATYSDVVPYLGHVFMTEDYERKREVLTAALDGSVADEILKLDWAILPKESQLAQILRSRGWQIATDEGNLLLLRNPSQDKLTAETR